MITYVYLHIYDPLKEENTSATGQTILDFFIFCNYKFVLSLLACFFHVLAFQDSQIPHCGAAKSNVSNHSLFEGRLSHLSGYTKLAAGALISMYVNTNRGKSSAEEKCARNFRSNSSLKGDELY